MHHYLNKMYDFLKNQLKNNRFINQVEFPIPPLLMQNKNNSTKENPLKYFEYLFKENGITQLRNNFINYSDYNESGNYKYDEESETMTYFIQEDDISGKWLETKKTLMIIIQADYIMNFALAVNLLMIILMNKKRNQPLQFT